MWDYLLHRIFGISNEGSTQFRFGGGVIAFQAQVLIALCVAAAGISWALSASALFALAIVAILAIAIVYVIRGTWQFADDHPDQAALGGSQWFKLRELQMASKNQSVVPPLPAISDPQKALPPVPDLLDPPDEE
jgi:hypothetical protein